MSPYQVQSLLEEFLQEHLLFADVHSPDHIKLSKDGRRIVKEGIPPEVAPKSPGWVEPRQVLALIEDKDPLAAVVEYEMQRRAARFMSTAKPPTNPLPPFLRVRDHKTDLKSGKSPSEAEPPKVDAETASADLPMREAESPDDDLLQKVEKEKEVKDSLSEAKEEEPPALSQEAESVDASEKEPPTEIREEEEKEKPEQREARPTTAQLLDFDVEEEDFDEDEGLQAEEIDETDVVFGTAQITQASMIKFMHQYPDSVLKFLMRRNLDGRPVPPEYEKIYDQWQQRGLMRGRLKRQLMRMMEWEEIPNLPINELVGKIRLKIVDMRFRDD